MAPRLLQTHWQVPARIEEVSDILDDAEALPRWWGEVYLAADIIAPGGPDGIGRRVKFHTRGWLPYTLRWVAELVAVDRPHSWTIRASGDLIGQGIWHLTQQGPVADIHYAWRVEVGKPLLRPVTPLLWPAFAANHRWAMAKGLAGLRRELARRRA
ncbi:polyketide cyclase [Pseudooceanicola lipolyticus]|uniref:Polyketide cyclase n=1 Tax=Pseudooceanicola lipolyticus TaxID=2029104 RepID=A0A2M8J168_9RHOB|nr:SRPBCC family protein [Pseudooceanicola lipolyticus]PJE36521.1 polyketide cyclase [Pseudooceanicola lipolyticus]